MKLPAAVLGLMDDLESAGFEAWAVGGCVRDALLGRTPQDFDLCTNALPAQMQSIFAHRQLVLAGEKHGTVGVVTDSGVVEITTFRTEGDYDDCRHPGWVRFVRSVEEDLARRDFTVNAMAFSPKRGLCDPFSGQNDLKNGLLRAVGNPEKRFSEDALRILRGARFSVTYRLVPEEATLDAMNRLAGSMEHLARERVFSELCKLIPPASEEDFRRFAHILRCAAPDLDRFSAAARLPGDLTLRLGALLSGADDPAEALNALRAGGAVREESATLARLARQDLGDLPGAVCAWGHETVRRALLIQQALTPEDDKLPQLLTRLESVPPLAISDLAVTGGDLIRQGFTPGPELGKALKKMLLAVLSGEISNEKASLLSFITSENR